MVPNSFVVGIIVCFFEPLQEWFARFPDLLTRLLVYVFLADVSTPLRDDSLIQNIVLVQHHKDFRDSRDQLGMRQPDQPLNASEQ